MAIVVMQAVIKLPECVFVLATLSLLSIVVYLLYSLQNKGNGRDLWRS